MPLLGFRSWLPDELAIYCGSGHGPLLVPNDMNDLRIPSCADNVLEALIRVDTMEPKRNHTE